VAQGIDPEFKLEQQQQQQKPKPKPNKKTDLNLFIYLFLFFSTGQCGLNAQPHTYKASTLPLEPCPPHPFFVVLIFRIGSPIFPGTGLGPRSSFLYLLSNWDYRHVLPHPALTIYFLHGSSSREWEFEQRVLLVWETLFGEGSFVDLLDVVSLMCLSVTYSSVGMLGPNHSS
jgi:hypothetical protein